VSDHDQNLEILQRVISAIEDADDATLRELFAPDHIDHLLWHEPLPLPGGDDEPLLDRYEQAEVNACGDFPETRITGEAQFACGDRVVTVWTSRAPHARSGVPVEERGIAISRIADGKIAESWTSADRLGLLQQLGAVETSRELFKKADLTL
jgi:ketosteroid isomerase-like protein